MKKIIVLTTIFLLLDQVSKMLISNFLLYNNSYEVVNNFFSLRYVHNYGAAFSILQGKTIFLILITLVTLICIYFVFIYQKNLNKKQIIAYAILFGGILGNLVDRIIYGYVRDFLAFSFGEYNFPVFNMADVFIVCSAIYIVLFIDWGTLDEDNL